MQHFWVDHFVIQQAQINAQTNLEAAQTVPNSRHHRFDSYLDELAFWFRKTWRTKKTDEAKF